MDKSWINKSRFSKDYFEGVQNFIEFAVEKESTNEKIFGPCQQCINNSSFSPQIVEEPLVWNDFVRGNIEWIFHEKSMLPSSCNPSQIDHRSNIRTSNL